MTFLEKETILQLTYLGFTILLTRYSHNKI